MELIISLAWDEIQDFFKLMAKLLLTLRNFTRVLYSLKHIWAAVKVSDIAS